MNRRKMRSPGNNNQGGSDGFPQPDASGKNQSVMLNNKILKILDTLTEKERKILKLRFGLSGSYCRTLEEVAREFDLTREHIKKIEAKAIRKMCHPSRIRRLEEFFAGGPPKLSKQLEKSSNVNKESQSLAELIEQSL